jgi:hypothetical protein
VGQLEAVARDAEGRIKDERRSASVRQAVVKEGSVEVTTHFFFSGWSGWSGPEDVITLSERYIAELVGIVSDGQTRGILTV